jgi:uncharacterized protein (TIGR02466 family)
MVNDAQIISPFIDIIYAKELEAKDKNSLFLEKALSVQQQHPLNNSWRCNTYSSVDTSYNLLDDELFKNLIEECKIHVKEFAKYYGVFADNAEATSGWINVANKGAYQEYHIHQASHFSVCYYINTPKDCGNIVFRSHEADKDMFPLPTTKELTHPANKTYCYPATAGTLVVFRANLPHMVELNKSNEPRVGVSINFVLR